MKTLVVFVFLLAGVMGVADKNTPAASETLIDLINKADKVPVYFVTNEVMYDHQVVKVSESSPGTINRYAVCSKMGETQALPSSYQSSKELVVSELNRVYKTDKFVMKSESEIPKNDKKGAAAIMFGEIEGKLAPALKSFDFTAVSAPVFVFCAMAGVYSSDALVDTGELNKSKKKEYEAAGVAVKPEIDVQLNNYLGVRMLYVDAKKGEAKYAIPEITNAESKSILAAKVTKCVTSLSDLTSQLDPASEAPNFNSKITGMFDALAAKHWKKQK
jgi:hypothetical protein